MERARKAMKVSDISVKGAALSLTIKNICLKLYKEEQLLIKYVIRFKSL